jgi:beta-lactam-binding protein with PASTA domain
MEGKHALSPVIEIKVFPQEPGLTFVPDVEGVTRGLAGNEIRAADLVPKFFDPPGNLREVVQQSPAAGTTVDRGTTVTLMIEPLA